VVQQGADAAGHVIPLLIAACPAIELRWRAERSANDAGLEYAQISALARAVAAAHVDDDLDCLARLFDEAENILVTGGPGERALIVEGFLEDLQSAIGWAGGEVEPVYALLGPRCRVAWDDLIALWNSIREKKASGELPRGPFDSGIPNIEDPELRRIFRSIQRPRK
jgi:hypothetical protein